MSDLDDCQARLGLTFNEPSLLRQALVHGSFVNETGAADVVSNERLEFLGDAVLGLVVADELYKTHPQEPEGRLTHIRAAIVRKETLADVARRLRLGDCLLLGKGEEGTGGRIKSSNLANAFEAVIGSAYLDSGFEGARTLVLLHLGVQLERAVNREFAPNYKAMLQEYVQSRDEPLPRYRVTSVAGPEHRKQFTAEVLLQGQPAGEGSGRTKKAAEVAAARSAWNRLQSKEAS